MDTNFDGVISQGEMGFALHSLGLQASPKEVSDLFAVLDPDGDGVVEFEELRTALLDPTRWNAPPPPKKLTPAQRARLRTDNVRHCAEVIEELYQFERAMGLGDPAELPPPSVDRALRDERRARAQARAWKVREGKVLEHPVSGPLMAQLDACWRKSPVLRPQTAPARVHAAATAARRKAAVHDYWLQKHREEIEMHAIAVEKQYIDDAKMRRGRRDAARATQLALYRTKATASTANAIERGEPFPNRRHVERNRQDIFTRARQRAWGQEIVFLPPTVARRELSVVRDRTSPDFAESVQAVQGLGEYH
jgi:hypothetical protein